MNDPAICQKQIGNTCAETFRTQPTQTTGKNTHGRFSFDTLRDPKFKVNTNRTSLPNAGENAVHIFGACHVLGDFWGNSLKINVQYLCKFSQ